MNLDLDPWMNGVKVALNAKGIAEDAAPKCAQDRVEWRAVVRINVMVATLTWSKTGRGSSEAPFFMFCFCSELLFGLQGTGPYCLRQWDAHLECP